MSSIRTRLARWFPDPPGFHWEFLWLPVLWALAMAVAYGLDAWWLYEQGNLSADLAFTAGQVFAALAGIGVAVLLVAGVARQLRPPVARPASLVCGLAAALAGLIGFGYLLWGPFYRESAVLADGQRLPANSHGLIDEGIEGLVLLQLIGLAVEIAGVAMASYMSFRGRRVGALLLRASTLLLTIQASVSFLTVGWLFAPSALLAIISSITVRDEGSAFPDPLSPEAGRDA